MSGYLDWAGNCDPHPYADDGFGDESVPSCGGWEWQQSSLVADDDTIILWPTMEKNGTPRIGINEEFADLITVTPELLEAAKKLLDEAERVALAAIDDGTRLPHLERASANMGEILGRIADCAS